MYVHARYIHTALVIIIIENLHVHSTSKFQLVPAEASLLYAHIDAHIPSAVIVFIVSCGRMQQLRFVSLASLILT